MPALPVAHRRSRPAALALVMVLALAACGGSSTPAPTPTPTPTAQPSPTPLDVSATFLEIVGDPQFSAEMEIDGTMEIGVTATLSGTIRGSGADSHTIFNVEVVGTTQASESITVDGTSWTRTDAGPWLEVPTAPAAEESSMTAWLATLEGVEDLGVETKAGRKLHHLSIGDDPLPPAVLGLDPSTFTDADVTIDFFAEDDGTPAIFTVEGTWLQLIAGESYQVEFVIDLTLSAIGSTISIEPPDDVWEPYASSLGYSMAHPAEFEVEFREGYDVITFRGQEWVYVEVFPDAAGLNPEGFRDEILGLVAESWGPPAETPVATTLGGEPGYFATFRFTYDDGSAGVAFDTMAMHQNVGWDVTLFSLPDEEDADFALYQQFLGAFAFGE
ncbi:MAG: hypothetical protein EPO36_10470 [Chloroflexota bacterium]|nr:MAG: hypothetical protein EPO36_10470 [Chloroflexota bacterium]